MSGAGIASSAADVGTTIGTDEVCGETRSESGCSISMKSVVFLPQTVFPMLSERNGGGVVAASGAPKIATGPPSGVVRRIGTFFRGCAARGWLALGMEAERPRGFDAEVFQHPVLLPSDSRVDSRTVGSGSWGGENGRLSVAASREAWRSESFWSSSVGRGIMSGAPKIREGIVWQSECLWAKEERRKSKGGTRLAPSPAPWKAGTEGWVNCCCSLGCDAFHARVRSTFHRGQESDCSECSGVALQACQTTAWKHFVSTVSLEQSKRRAVNLVELLRVDVNGYQLMIFDISNRSILRIAYLLRPQNETARLDLRKITPFLDLHIEKIEMSWSNLIQVIFLRD